MSKLKREQRLKRLVKNADLQTDRSKLRAVIWHDAIERDIPVEFFEALKASKSGLDLLCVNVTHGEVHELEDVVLVVTEKSADGTWETTIIPKTWLIKIE